MKKILKFIILLLVILPIYVSATVKGTYASTLNSTRTYINKYSTKDRYFILGRDIFGFSNGRPTTNSDFSHGNGGYISAEEYKMSVRDGASYLSGGLDYWTQSSAGNGNKYYISFDLLTKEQNESSGVRITEFVKPNTRITGSGTQSNPWEFLNYYSINIQKNVEDDNIKIEVTPEMVDRGESATVKITDTINYMYSENDNCNLIHVRDEGTFVHYYKTQKLASDLYCTATFEERKTRISYDCGVGATGNIPDVVVPYGSKYTYAKTSLCGTREGYTQKNDVWLDDSGSNKDSNGTQYKGTINSWKNTASKITLHRAYNDTQKPKVTVTAYKYDSSKPNHLGEIVKDAQTFTKDGTYTVNSNWLNYHIVYGIETIDNEAISSITLKKNQVMKKSNNITYTSTTMPAQNKTVQYVEFNPDGSEDGYRNLQWVVTDKSDSTFVTGKSNKTTVTLTAKMDTIGPNCSFTYGSNRVTLSYTDSLSETKSYGLTKTEGVNYNSKKYYNQAAGSFYGYAKDNAGNESSCKTTLINTIVDGSIESKKKCARGDDYYVLTTSTCGAYNCKCPDGKYEYEGTCYTIGDSRCDGSGSCNNAAARELLGGGSDGTNCYRCLYSPVDKVCSYGFLNAADSTVGSCSASTPACSSSGHKGNKKIECAGPYPTYAFGATTKNSPVYDCKKNTFTCDASHVGKTYVSCADNHVCPEDAVGYTLINDNYCYKEQ